MVFNPGPFYTGSFPISLNFYSLDANLKAWLKGLDDAPKLDTLSAIRLAQAAGFDGVDVTAYYIPGYEASSLPQIAEAEVIKSVHAIRRLAEDLHLAISGTGVGNDFVHPDEQVRLTHISRTKYWTRMAKEMGAPVLRVFSGPIPADLDAMGWEQVVGTRLVPALQEIAEYAAAYGVAIGLQNHGDMLSTADQIIHTIQWADCPNLGIINDTGSFRPFRGSAVNYDWYHDIAKALPYSIGFQVKEHPDGPGSEEWLDLPRFFSILRQSAYRGYLPIELLWRQGEADHPGHRAAPPFEDIARFLSQVRRAMNESANL